MIDKSNSRDLLPSLSLVSRMLRSIYYLWEVRALSCSNASGGWHATESFTTAWSLVGDAVDTHIIPVGHLRLMLFTAFAH
jgi:hypothetical protein